MAHDDMFEGREAAVGHAGPNRMTNLLLVAVGGCVGAVLRYLVEAAMTDRYGTGFPWGTLAINVAGAFLLGALVALTLERQLLPMALRPALGIGLLGAFTTYSTFALDTLVLVEEGLLLRAGVYVGATNIAGIGAAMLGLLVGRNVPAG